MGEKHWQFNLPHESQNAGTSGSEKELKVGVSTPSVFNLLPKDFFLGVWVSFHLVFFFFISLSSLFLCGPLDLRPEISCGSNYAGKGSTDK